MNFTNNCIHASNTESNIMGFFLSQDNPELLSDLSARYRRFASRAKRLHQRRTASPSSQIGLRKILRSLAPTCKDIVVSCQMGIGTIIRGSDCCNFIFKVIWNII